MGNSFIGFPVPRAKIADMITGEAAPKDHHADHENGGDDEVDCTGLEGAGGITLPWADLYWEFLFLSIDGFHCASGGEGTCSIMEDGVCLHTGYTAGSYAILRKIIGHTWTPLNWSKKRRIRFALYIKSDADNVGDFYLCSGDVTYGPLVGFLVRAGTVYGITRSNGYETLVALKVLSAGAYGTTLSLDCRFYPGDRCDFFIDGVLEGTTGANLPTGSSYAAEIISLKVENLTTADRKYMTVALSTFWQGA